MSLIVVGALGSKRGAPGIDPATLSPTGHWIGGVGITLNTTPDPDQISAWADQSGNLWHMQQATTGAQPFASLIRSPADYAPGYTADANRFLARNMGHFSASTFTLLAVATFPNTIGAKSATISLSPNVIGDGGGYSGLLAYSVGGAPRMSVYTFDATYRTPGDVVAAFDEKLVLLFRLTGGNLHARVIWPGGDNQATRPSTPDVGVSLANPRLGHGPGTSASSRFRGTIYEAAAWRDVALTDDQITDVAAFLLRRYASAT